MSDHAPVAHLTVPSDLLGTDVPVRVQQFGAADRWVWLLHGRGGGLAELGPAFDAVAAAVGAGALSPLTLAAPDAPWLDRAAWFVDSAQLPLETALLTEVLPVVEATAGRPGGRGGRTVAGISMGGAAALRYALVHRQLFGSALLLSPAVYEGEPPADSSARTSGAFGTPFSAARWHGAMDYDVLLSGAAPAALRVVTVVGDEEPVHGEGRAYDLEVEAARLHVALKRRPGIASSLRVVGGGHDWSVWAPGLVEGLQQLGLGGSTHVQ